MKHLKMHYCGLENPYAGEWPNNLAYELLSMNGINELPDGELTARVEYLIELLPYPDNRIVELRYRDGNIFPQIADKVSLSASNARTRLMDALVRLSAPAYVDILLTGELPSAEDWSAHSVSERFSTRTANQLRRMGIHTLADVRRVLTEHSVDELLSAHGVGEKMYNELLAFSENFSTNAIPQQQFRQKN